jgi:hypothetical protein
MIFTAIGAAVFGAGTFLAGATAAVLSVGASLGLNYLTQSLSGQDNKQQGFSIQGKLQSGGTVPRSFIAGYYATGGSLVYHNFWGENGETPNAYLTQVIALSDLPSGALREVWVNGELCTLNTGAQHAEFGYPVSQYYKDDQNYLWVKYYDGTQTAADPYLVSRVSSTDRPYGTDRVGYGISYVIVTSLLNDKLFSSGVPELKFALDGTRFYDPTRDSSVGGSGPQRYANPATWGGDGDHLPAVQAYNLLRGMFYGGRWFYGLQKMTAARLPTVNWLVQIDKCRAGIIGKDGLEPTYRAGGQINVNVQIASTLEALLASCQGKVAEIGGSFKIHVGAPGTPTFSWTDDDLLSTDEQIYRPFFALSDSTNGVVATYPDPAQGWNVATAPAYQRTDQVEIDGGIELWANPALDFVPYPEQVQRLQKSAVEEAQRARTHVVTFPPAFWMIEPFDIGQWTSARNGYTNKSFRVDKVVDRANLDVPAAVTEVDPADYSWSPEEYIPPGIGGTRLPRPAPQGLLDFSVAAGVDIDETGLQRRPTIDLSFDNSLPGIAGIAFAVRRAATLVVVYRGQADYGLSEGTVRITQGILPLTDYEVQAQYIPTAPRDVIPSDWIPVTTVDVRLSLVDFEAAVKHQVTKAIEEFKEDYERFKSLASSVVAVNTARNWIDKKETRRELASVTGEANAQITELWVVATDLDASLAARTEEYNSRFGTVEGSITTEIQTRSAADGALSARIDTLTAQTTTSFAEVNTALIAQASATSTLAGQVGSFTTTLNGHTATLNVLSASIDGHKVQYGVTGTIDGVTGGFVLTGARRLDGGAAFSLVIRADVILDGTMTGSKFIAGTIDAIYLRANSIDSSRIAINGVDLLNLIDGAASNTQGVAITPVSNASGWVTLASTTVNIQGGRALVIGQVRNDSNGNCGLKLLVDGSERTPYQWTAPDIVTVQPTGVVSISTNQGYAAASLVVTDAIFGLSEGNHSFALQGYGKLLNAGALIVINNRR